MTLTLEIPDELIPVLTKEATQRGLSVNEYALQLLVSGSSATGSPKTGADLVAYWQAADLIGTRDDLLDTEIHARTLRTQAEKRTRSNE